MILELGTALSYNIGMINARCEICGREKEVRNYKGKQLLCGMHREQMRRHGKILKRTLSSPNEFVDCGTHYEMIIYNRDLKEVARALIDKEDKERASKIGSWCLSRGYPFNGRIKSTLHLYLLGRQKGLEIDHINNNKLDNRRSNLRFVPHSMNTQSWVQCYKRKLAEDFKTHLIEGKDAESFFEELLK